MKHLLITSALCLAATTAWAGGSGHDPVPAPSPAAAAPSYTTNAPSANANSVARTEPVTARTGPVTVNNTPGSGGYNGPRYTTPDAIAPSIVTANECALPRSFGVSAILAGLSGGWANETDSCKHIRLSRTLEKMQDHDGAREALCLEDDMRRAAYSSGHPCAKDRLGWVK